MPDQRAELVRMGLPCDRTAPGLIRTALDRALRRERVREDALLIASELVSNAVLHSGCCGHHIIHVHVTAAQGRLVISVHDPGLLMQTAERRAEGSGSGGWGLQIVARLARRWGAERLDGYRVWAELAF